MLLHSGLVDILKGQPHVERIAVIHKAGDHGMSDHEQSLPVQFTTTPLHFFFFEK